MTPAIYVHLAAAAIVAHAARRAGPIGARTLASSATRLPRSAAQLRAAADSTDSGGGHSVGAQPEVSAEEKAAQQRFMEHQKTAARLSAAVEARSLVQYSTGYAVISTLASQPQLAGYPGGGVVGFAPNGEGLPLFFFSTMSGHTQDLLKSPKASLTVTASGFAGAADARVNLVGDIERVPDEHVQAAREAYLATHKDAFWIDFGDFSAFQMTSLKGVRFVGGFARAADITPDEFLGAKPDPILAFSAPIAGHMNDDHSDSTVAMIGHYVGLDVEGAQITSVDSLGMTVKVQRGSSSFKLRLPFPRPAESRKDVKDLIVEMTRASAAGAPSG